MIKEITGNKRLKLELDGGMSGDRQIIKSKTFSNISLEATGEAMYKTGKALVDLQSLELINIKKLEDTILINE